MLGVFANLTYLVVAGALVVRAVGQAGSARLARHWAGKEFSKFSGLVLRMVGVVVAFGGCCIVGALLFGPTLLGIVFGASYREHHETLVAVLVAGTITWISSILGYAIGATRHFGRFIVPYLVLVILTLATSLIMIPRWGLGGAVLALNVIACASIAAPMYILLTAYRQHARSA